MCGYDCDVVDVEFDLSPSNDYVLCEAGVSSKQLQLALISDAGAAAANPFDMWSEPVERMPKRRTFQLRERPMPISDQRRVAPLIESDA